MKRGTNYNRRMAEVSAASAIAAARSGELVRRAFTCRDCQDCGKPLAGRDHEDCVEPQEAS